MANIAHSILKKGGINRLSRLHLSQLKNSANFALLNFVFKFSWFNEQVAYPQLLLRDTTLFLC